MNCTMLWHKEPKRKKKKIFLFLFLIVLGIIIFSMNSYAGMMEDIEIAMEFDDSTDSTGNITFTEHGTVAYGSTDCVHGDCFQGSGGDSNYIDATGIYFLNGKSAYTIAFWVYPTGNTLNWLMEWARGQSSYDIQLWRDNANHWGSTYPNSQLFDTQPQLNGWIHLTYSYDGSGVHMYLNGTEIGSPASAPDPAMGGTYTSTETLTFFKDTISAGRYFRFKVDEFYVWGRRLTDLEIKNLYAQNDSSWYSTGFGESSPDIISPKYFNFANNATNATKGQSVKFNVTFTDDVDLDTYTFAHNQSGTLTNVTTMSINGTSYLANESVIITLDTGNICGKFYVNDSAGNINSTPLLCFNITPLSYVRSLRVYDRFDNNMLKIFFYSNGEAHFNESVYAKSFIENSYPFKTDKEIAYSQVLSIDLSSTENYHNTAIPECKSNGGIDITCNIKALFKSIQNLDERLKTLESIWDNINKLWDNNNKNKASINNLNTEYDQEVKNKLSKNIKIETFNTTEGNASIVDMDTVAVNEILTKSKVPDIGIDYCNLILTTDIYNKSTHYAYKELNGKYYLDSEYRWLVLEGCMKQQLIEECKDKKRPYCP